MMRFSIKQKPKELQRLRAVMQRRALEYPLIENPVTGDVLGDLVNFMKHEAAESEKCSKLEQQAGIRFGSSKQRTAIKSYDATFQENIDMTVGEWKKLHKKTFGDVVNDDLNRRIVPGKKLKDSDRMVIRKHKPVDEEKLILGEKEVGIVLTLEGRHIDMKFDFSNEEMADERNARGIWQRINKAGQLVGCSLMDINENYPLGNSYWFLIERERRRHLSFGYSKRANLANLKFSRKQVDSFEEHPNIHGVLSLYFGDELVGYDIVAFSEFFNPKCIIPRLKIPR